MEKFKLQSLIVLFFTFCITAQAAPKYEYLITECNLDGKGAFPVRVTIQGQDAQFNFKTDSSPNDLYDVVLIEETVSQQTLETQGINSVTSGTLKIWNYEGEFISDGPTHRTRAKFKEGVRDGAVFIFSDFYDGKWVNRTLKGTCNLIQNDSIGVHN